MMAITTTIGLCGLCFLAGWVLGNRYHVRTLARLLRRARMRIAAKRVPDPDEMERACTPERLPTLILAHARGGRR